MDRRNMKSVSSENRNSSTACGKQQQKDSRTKTSTENNTKMLLIARTHARTCMHIVQFLKIIFVLFILFFNLKKQSIRTIIYIIQLKQKARTFVFGWHVLAFDKAFIHFIHSVGIFQREKKISRNANYSIFQRRQNIPHIST